MTEWVLVGIEGLFYHLGVFRGRSGEHRRGRKSEYRPDSRGPVINKKLNFRLLSQLKYVRELRSILSPFR